MFSKSTKPQAIPDPSLVADAAARRGPKVASLIAEDLVVDGGLSGEVDLHVDGTVRGDVKVATLTIGETGVIEGAVEAQSVDCRGRVVGAITADQVRLYGPAHVDGDIAHDQLTMETGAFFQGRSLRLDKARSEPLELTLVAAE